MHKIGASCNEPSEIMLIFKLVASESEAIFQRLQCELEPPELLSSGCEELTHARQCPGHSNLDAHCRRYEQDNASVRGFGAAEVRDVLNNAVERTSVAHSEFLLTIRDHLLCFGAC